MKPLPRMRYPRIGDDFKNYRGYAGNLNTGFNGITTESVAPTVAYHEKLK
jgi:hypothetical protein